MSDNPILCDDGRRPDWKVGFTGVDDIYHGADVNAPSGLVKVGFVLTREVTEEDFITYWCGLYGSKWRQRYNNYIAVYPAQRRYFEAVMD